MSTGLIHMYYGDGKGKTTAAVGLAVRAAGCGRRVVFAQFLKGRPTGELAPLKELGVKLIRSDKDLGFCWELTEEQMVVWRAEQTRLFGEIREAVSGAEPVDLLVLDEALNVAAKELLQKEELLEFIAQKPEGLEIVLTGRPAPEWLLEKADYITEMKCHRHPYDRGVMAREAIEY